MVLEDWAGNTTAYDYPIVCDQTAPKIEPLREPFRQEDTSVEEDLDNWETAKTLVKDYTRLDFLPEEGLDAATQNLPVIGFRVSDTDGASSIGAQDEQLRVEYSYTMGDNPKHGREWTALQPDPDNAYRLPIAYQTLLPRGQQATETNFVARCQPTDEHRIVIRVTDLAGNVAERTFIFFLKLIAPPITLTDCAPADTLRAASLVNPNFDFVFSRGFDLYDAHIRYDLNLSRHSLAPSFKVRVRPFADRVHSELTHLKYSRGVVAIQGKDGTLFVESRKPDANRSIQAARHVAQFGKTPQGSTSRIGYEDGEVAGSQHAITSAEVGVGEASICSKQDVSYVLLTPKGYTRTFDADGGVEVTPNTTYLLRTRMNGEFKLPDGTALPWHNHVPDIDGSIAVELKHKYGVQMEAGATRVIEVRQSIAGLSMTRPPMSLSLQGVPNGAPTPIDVQADSFCKQHLRMQWFFNNPGAITTHHP
jgi:hypothetical protein